jgi:hypothetical protein
VGSNPSRGSMRYINLDFGRLAERSNALVLKTSVPRGTVGSNPTSSAIGLVVQPVRIPACHAGGREFESRPDRKKYTNMS